MTNKSTRLDADGIWLSRELEKIEDKIFEVQYADIIYPQLFPIDTTTVGPVDDIYTYRVMDRVGKFKTIQDRSSDLPRVDVTRKEISQGVVTIGASFGYGIHETRAARAKGLPIQESKVSAVRRAYEERVQDVALYGDAAAGIKGMFNSPDVAALNVTLTWFSTTATADEQLRILNGAVGHMMKSTNMVEKPNTILMAYEDFKIINETPRSSTSDTTVREYFLRNDPFINAIIPLNELDDFGGAGQNRMIVYNRSPEKLKLHIPQPLEFLPPQQHNLEYTVATHARVMGPSIYFPASMLYVNQTP